VAGEKKEEKKKRAGSKRATNELTTRCGPQFHAENLFSAQIYPRLPAPSSTTDSTAAAATPPGTHLSPNTDTDTYTWDRIPPNLLADLTQLDWRQQNRHCDGHVHGVNEPAQGREHGDEAGGVSGWAEGTSRTPACLLLSAALAVPSICMS